MTATRDRARAVAPRTMRLVPLIAAVSASLLAAAPTIAGAQGIRVSGTTYIQLVELRPLVTDSAPASSIAGTGEWRTTTDGVPALCPLNSAYCRFERSGRRMSATPALQDVTIAGWGWSQGLSFHANVRARTQLGGAAFTFPRADDNFDVLAAYAELDRGQWRGRLGRQWITGGLGAYDFDGASAEARRDAVSLEGWAGRALIAGLNEPYTSEQLAAVENLAPSQGGLIAGGRARWRPDALVAATAMYQRVIAADRSGLYSERAALDASVRRFGATFDLNLTYDFAGDDWNEARLRIGAGATREIGASLELRHSQPYFELWTIWGAFAPVGYDESRATLDWRPKRVPVMFALRGSYRTYADASAGFDLRTNGWRAGADVIWNAAESLGASASYDVDIGSGASSEEARVGVRWMQPEGVALAANATVTQNIYEFRVGTGRIYGLMASGSVPLQRDLRLALDAGLFQHTLTNGAPGPDWTQRRVSARFEWTVGRDPGTGAGGAP